MIKLKTDCKKCIHDRICKNRNNAKHAAERLKDTIYGCGPSDDYGWEIMSNYLNINIDFSCPNYMETKE